MIYLREYIRRILKETTNEKFLKDLGVLGGEWDEIQKDIPTETETRAIYGNWWDEEKQDVIQDYKDKDVTFQVTKGEEKPSYTEENPAHYDDEHAAQRRVKYGQTKKEIDVERKLMTLWQKHADIEFFKSNAITYSHNINYRSAARGMGKSGIKTIENYSPSLLIKAQEKQQKDAISVAAKYAPGSWPSIQGQIGDGWGFIVKGHPIFASFEDVASQTQRMASDQAREYHKSSGLPKRAGIERVGKTEIHPKRMRMMTKLSKRYEDPDLYLKTIANPVVLDEQDILDRFQKGKKNYGTNMLEEVILDNWIVAAWYISSNKMPGANKFFERSLKNNLLNKPIYIVDSNREQTLINPTNPDDVKKFLRWIRPKEDE